MMPLFFSLSRNPALFSQGLKRFLNIQASYPIKDSGNKKAAAIYVISSDKKTEEDSVKYRERSHTQLKANLSEDIDPIYLQEESDLALFHVVPTSFDINSENEVNVFGGHIASMLLKPRDFSYIPHSCMSKVVQGMPLGPKKSVIVYLGDRAIKLVDQDFTYKAGYHSDGTAPIFLTGSMVDKKGEEFGSLQYLIVIPLKHLSIDKAMILQNVYRYQNDEEHMYYKRQTDACGQAVMAAFGIKEFTSNGLTTQEAILNIGSKFILSELRESFLDSAAKSKLSDNPEEVYLGRKDMRPDNPMSSNNSIKLK